MDKAMERRWGYSHRAAGLFTLQGLSAADMYGRDALGVRKDGKTHNIDKYTERVHPFLSVQAPFLARPRRLHSMA